MPSLSSRMGGQGAKANAPMRPSAIAALPPSTGIVSQAGHVRKVPIVLQKSFWVTNEIFKDC